MRLENESPGASSSAQGPTIIDSSMPSEKRELEDKSETSGMPEKTQRISSVCIGYGASDKIGEAHCLEKYEEDLKKLAEEYKAGQG